MLWLALALASPADDLAAQASELALRIAAGTKSRSGVWPSYRPGCSSA